MDRFESARHAAAAAWSVFWQVFTWCREVKVEPGVKMISLEAKHKVEFEV